VAQNAATAQLGAYAANFVMSKPALGVTDALEHIIEEKLEVVDGRLRVPTGPGVGIIIVDKAMCVNMADGEPFWDQHWYPLETGGS